MTVTHHTDTYEPDIPMWMPSATLTCDYCTTAKHGDVLGEATFEGWTRWIGGLDVCPDCRRRMTTRP